MRLGGFHRLWVVLSLIYLIFIFIYVILIWPNPINIPNKDKFYESLPIAAKEILIYTPNNEENGFANKRGYAVKMPNNYTLYFKENTSSEKMRQACANYWAQVEKEATLQKLAISFVSFLFWIIPCITIYVLGLVIHWIIQGFKNERKVSSKCQIIRNR